MNHYDPTFDLKIIVGHCDIFHSPVILGYILKTIWCMNIILQDYWLYDHIFDLKVNVCHCDLYFMVQ